MTSGFFYFIVVVVTVLIILAVRQFLLWYWKINAIESLLIEIRDALRERDDKSIDL